MGVDLSLEMVRLAAKKVDDPRFQVIWGDIEMIPVHRLCDCCVVYNAFPHFEDPLRLIVRLARWLKPGGRLTVVHGMSLEMLQGHHMKSAKHVSREMLSVKEMAKAFAPWFEVDTEIADRDKYIVSGKRNKVKQKS